jgi:hypothetical protein
LLQISRTSFWKWRRPPDRLEIRGSYLRSLSASLLRSLARSRHSTKPIQEAEEKLYDVRRKQEEIQNKIKTATEEITAAQAEVPTDLYIGDVRFLRG